MLIGFHQLFTWPPPSQKRYKALKLDLAYSASRFCDEVLKEAGHPPNRQVSSEDSRERAYLGQEPGNIKALYRRAQGLLGSNDFEEAPVIEAARMGQHVGIPENREDRLWKVSPRRPYAANSAWHINRHNEAKQAVDRRLSDPSSLKHFRLPASIPHGFSAKKTNNKHLEAVRDCKSILELEPTNKVREGVGVRCARDI